MNSSVVGDLQERPFRHVPVSMATASLDSDTCKGLILVKVQEIVYDSR